MLGACDVQSSLLRALLTTQNLWFTQSRGKHMMSILHAAHGNIPSRTALEANIPAIEDENAWSESYINISPSAFFCS